MYQKANDSSQNFMEVAQPLPQMLSAQTQTITLLWKFDKRHSRGRLVVCMNACCWSNTSHSIIVNIGGSSGSGMSVLVFEKLTMGSASETAMHNRQIDDARAEYAARRLRLPQQLRAE